MRILVIGATGLIGQAVCARLAADGHSLVGSSRHAEPTSLSNVERWVRIDLAKATELKNWLPHLQDIDVVVNCVGVLQDNPREDTNAAHVTGPEALFRACVVAGIRRVIHFSAIGVDQHQASRFSETKLAGDKALMDLPLDWVILRPSVVLGVAVFGASALVRGLAALPALPVMPDTGPLQVVMLEDVTETVAFFAAPDAPACVTLDLAGPERLPFAKLVGRYRAWLGWQPARHVLLPPWSARLLYRLGDLAGAFGWRPPLRTTARQEIVHGAVGDPVPWSEMTGIRPRCLESWLRQNPASVQDRWFAKLYFVKPLLFAILALFWVMTGVISLTIGYDHGVELMVRAQTGLLAGPGVIAGAISDLLIGIAIACRKTTRLGLWAAIGLTLFYITAGTVMLPELWQQPLGPLLKIWPILAAHFAALAILKER